MSQMVEKKRKLNNHLKSLMDVNIEYEKESGKGWGIYIESRLLFSSYPGLLTLH